MQLSGSAAGGEIDRQLPGGDEIFLDHVAHFVRDAAAASRAFARKGVAEKEMAAVQASQNIFASEYVVFPATRRARA